MKTKQLQVEFANAGEANAAMFFVNELNLGEDGWAMIAPFGDFPSEALLPTADGGVKKQKAIQRITKKHGEEMVAQFHNSRAGLKKFRRGCNIFLGHPDAPGIGSRYPDKEPKGLFSDMAVREKGIYGLPVFTNDGMDLVEGRKLVDGKRVRGFSARLIESMPDGDKDGVPVYCPTQIVSAGLTPHPHLPVEFFNSQNLLAAAKAEAEKQPSNQATTMKKKIIALCAKLGIQFANDADDAATEAALGQIEEKVAGFANEKQTLETKVTGLETNVTTLAAERDTARTELTASRTQFANERMARINDEIATAVIQGRITDAERATWLPRFNVPAQFANELAAIRSLQPKVKTSTITLERGQRRDQVDLANAPQKRQFANEVIAEIAAEQKLDPIRHSKQILNLARSRHPQLFEAPHVEIKR